jgi:predicted nucleic acid-binding protein
MILVDTGPLVALSDPRDRQHTAAAAHLKKLADRRFVTCDAVLVEACFHLPRAPQRRRLRALLETFQVGQSAHALEEGFRDAVFDWLARYADHEPDWADGCLAVLSGLDKTARVWTYDGEFRTTWRRPNGSAIPMAVK